MTTEQKAQAMLNEARDAHVNPDDYLVGHTALCRAIEQREATMREAAEREERLVEEMRSGIARAETQHEATKQEFADFRQEVSDEVSGLCLGIVPARLKHLIIPAPKPDPLVEVAKSLGTYNTAAKHWAGDVRAKLDDLGLEIKEKNDGL